MALSITSSTLTLGHRTGVSESWNFGPGGEAISGTLTHKHITGATFTWNYGGGAGSTSPNPNPVSPTFDPKLEANALYSKPMALCALGYARIGASPAPIVGPYLTDTTVDFIVSFGVPANVEGDRKIYKIYLDNELAWSSAAGGTLPGDGTFAAEPFDFVFKPGRLDQTVCSLETEKFPGDECAYRPQMILEIRNLVFARYMERTGKPVPYVAIEVGDVTDGADPLDFINLGDALERIAFSPWAGYTSETFEAVGITDVVDAILIKDNFTVVQLCQSVTREYRNIDLLVSDKTRVKDRGSSVAPGFVFDRNTIISDDEAVVIGRSGATEQRREHELIAIDPAQDYTAVPSLSKIPRNPMVISAAVGKETVTLPVVIDANTRQALATFSQQYEENARRKVAFKVRAAGYPIEPGDLFALTDIADGIDNEVFKCTSTTHGANWIVEVEGEAILRCSIYSDLFDAATWDPATVTAVTLSGYDLVATNTGTTSPEQGARVAAASAKDSGKYYFELTSTVGGVGDRSLGIGPPASNYTNLGDAILGCLVYLGSGQVWANGVDTGIGPMLIPEGWHLRFAVDLDNRKVWFSNLAPAAGDEIWNNDPANDPATNVGGITIPGSGVVVPFCTFGGAFGSSGQVITANFGASSFFGLVPDGFMPGWPL
jgi:hypothetical protein